MIKSNAIGVLGDRSAEKPGRMRRAVNEAHNNFKYHIKFQITKRVCPSGEARFTFARV